MSYLSLYYNCDSDNFLMKSKLYIFFFILGYFCNIAYAIKPFRNISVDNGLSSNTINCIFKDSGKYIWLGLPNGLNRFDGVDIISVKYFENQFIVSISEIDSLNLFVASERNLYKYNRRENTASKYELERNQDIKIKKILPDKKENLLIATNRGLFTFVSNKVEKIQSVSSDITDITVDNNNIYWITTTSGLISYNVLSGSLDTYYLFNNKSSNNFSSLSLDNNNIYLGFQNSIYCFDIIAKAFDKIIDLDNNYILNIYYNDNRLYVGTNGGGLKIISLTDRSIVSLTHNPSNPESISSNAIYSFLLDGESFWIGTFVGGLNYTPYIRNIFSTYSKSGTFDSRGVNIRSMNLIGDNKILGTRSGFIYFGKEKVHIFSTENTPALRSNIILCIYQFKDKYLIGTYGGGIYLFNPDKLTVDRFKKDNVFIDNSFYSITDDNNGYLWLGTLNGLIRYDVKADKYEVFTTINSGLINKDIYYITADTKNRIWIGTNEGICYYENGKIYVPKDIDLSFIKTVRYLFSDKAGNIWIGSEKDGLIKVSPDIDSFEHITTSDFLPDNYVLSIIEDQEQYIWISTPKGMVRYNPESADYRIFSLYDGIPWYTFNSAVQMADDGTLWWGNEKGLVYLNPKDKLLKSTSNNQIAITSIYIDGKLEEVGSKMLPVSSEYMKVIKLSPSQNSIGIHFSDRLYTIPQSEIYEYKLEGLDDKWQRIIGRNDLYISNLPSGSYKLLLRKAGSEEPMQSISIIKTKSYTIYVWLFIIAILIVASVLTFRMNILKTKRLKEKFIQSSSKVKYQSIKMEENEISQIKEALLKYFEEEQPYLNSELKLEDVSNAIHHSKTRVSQVLNQYLQSNFADFTNTYRIQVFKEKAEEGLIQQYTLSALSKECGFSSRSSFFHSFKKITGQTPLEYLKEAGIKIDKP